MRPFITLLWARIGSESPKVDYDLVISVGEDVRAVCTHLLSVVPTFAPAGAPLCPPVPSSVYGSLCQARNS